MGTKLQLLFMNLGSTVAGFIIAFLYSWKLTLVFLGGCFPMFGIMAGAMTMNENMSKTHATMYEKVGMCMCIVCLFVCCVCYYGGGGGMVVAGHYVRKDR
jgi:hypothetical protein